MGKIIQIKVNSSEQNKDKGFYVLMTSGTSVACLQDDEYIVSEEAISSLNEKDVIYELVVPKRGVIQCAPQTKV